MTTAGTPNVQLVALLVDIDADFSWLPGTILVARQYLEPALDRLSAYGLQLLGLEGFLLEGQFVSPRLEWIYDLTSGQRRRPLDEFVRSLPNEAWSDIAVAWLERKTVRESRLPLSLEACVTGAAEFWHCPSGRVLARVRTFAAVINRGLQPSPLIAFEIVAGEVSREPVARTTLEGASSAADALAQIKAWPEHWWIELTPGSGSDASV